MTIFYIPPTDGLYMSYRTINAFYQLKETIADEQFDKELFDTPIYFSKQHELAVSQLVRKISHFVLDMLKKKIIAGSVAHDPTAFAQLEFITMSPYYTSQYTYTYHIHSY